MQHKKLFVVEVLHQAYVLAEDGRGAIALEGQVCRQEPPYVYAIPVVDNVLGWDLDCLVYHGGKQDIRLGEVLNSYLPPAEDLDALMIRKPS